MDKVKLIVLQPGHFHAALVQKKMITSIDNAVHVYATPGNDLENYLQLIKKYNSRRHNPTKWETKVYRGQDYLQKALIEKMGNVMITAGNNRHKTRHIHEFIKRGINVLADKPLAINQNDFQLLLKSFEEAQSKNVLLYDIMTERSEINNIIQKELLHFTQIMGKLTEGNKEQPTIEKKSVHHFYKQVSGSAIIRPEWYFDTRQQGEGIVDVTTHLVDLIQWQLFPEMVIDYKNDIQMVNAKRWATQISESQYKMVTGGCELPDNPQINNNHLNVYANGEMYYKIKDKTAKVTVIWDYKAPRGGGDSHYSIIRGTRSDLVIMQTEKENYQPSLYIRLKDDTNPEDFENSLRELLDSHFQNRYPNISCIRSNNKTWKINIPDDYRTDHESHFGEVVERYLDYLIDGKLPDWEIPNIIAKYYTTISALKMARENKADI